MKKSSDSIPSGTSNKKELNDKVKQLWGMLAFVFSNAFSSFQIRSMHPHILSMHRLLSCMWFHMMVYYMRRSQDLLSCVLRICKASLVCVLIFSHQAHRLFQVRIISESFLSCILSILSGLAKHTTFIWLLSCMVSVSHV